MNIIPDGSILCIECGKPISKKNGDFYYSKCKGSRIGNKSIPKKVVFIHKSCYHNNYFKDR